METCCLTVLKSGSPEPRCPRGQPGPEATGRAPPWPPSGGAGRSSACVRAHSRLRACRHHTVCVCPPSLPAHEDTRHRELGSTLMAFFNLLPDEAPSQMVRTSPLWRKRPFFPVPETGCFLWSACFGGREGCASCVWLRGQHQGASISAAGPDTLLGSWGGPALHQLPSFPVGQEAVCAGV